MARANAVDGTPRLLREPRFVEGAAVSAARAKAMHPRLLREPRFVEGGSKPNANSSTKGPRGFFGSRASLREERSPAAESCQGVPAASSGAALR